MCSNAPVWSPAQWHSEIWPSIHPLVLTLAISRTLTQKTGNLATSKRAQRKVYTWLKDGTTLNSEFGRRGSGWAMNVLFSQRSLVFGIFPISYVGGKSKWKGWVLPKTHTHLHEKEGGPKSLCKGTVIGVDAPEFVHFDFKSLDINVNASTLLS